MKLHAFTARKLRTFLEEVAEKPVPLPGEAILRAAAAAEFAVELAQRRRSKTVLPFLGRKERLAEKRAKHRTSTAEIRVAVRERAGGVCEACGNRWGFWGWSMDHWLSGNGRRRQKQSVENCWALCGTGTTGCHGDRGANRAPAWANVCVPSGTVFWNERFQAHCEKYGFKFEPHIEHQPVRRWR